MIIGRRCTSCMLLCLSVLCIFWKASQLLLECFCACAQVDKIYIFGGTENDKLNKNEKMFHIKDCT